ncbi:patatin-like phospholipase family protein [Urbifossiella limnaea]|uniref:NTE family protein RssA n=1 Tax=Urbifossiella limnaea TaxID=2528023 RepID=A0A517XMQ8_9BACT|nr:patatin-like phospholipase family protein [Urbifossiella limnaea]QDU18772.1 NTE family protein RssA [Urbifossiella limnaea]
MDTDILALVRIHEYFRGISEEAMADVLAAARVRTFAAGDVVHQPDDPLVTVGFILRGRLKSVKVDAAGRESLLRVFNRGEQYGMMLGVLAEPVPVRVFALEPATVLEVDYETAMELTLRHPDLRQLWLKTYAGTLRNQLFGSTRSKAPMMLGLVHDSPATAAAARRLVDRLRGIGETLGVFSDSDEWRGVAGIRFRSMVEDGRMLEPEEIRRQTVEWKDVNRIVFDLRLDQPSERVTRLFEMADRLVYFVPAAAGAAAVARLRALGVPARGWRDKVCIAWLLDAAPPVAPAVPGLAEVVRRTFTLVGPALQLPWGRAAAGGLERLVHDLRGVRIGVALGGGAARGMTHLGVLKALEQSGIVVDMIAGTSAGAMTGIMYASGIDPDHNAASFAADLRPSWLFRRLPAGDQWYLLYKYRRGHFDPMLRPYLHDWTLEQLAVPCLSVTVDLVGGNSVVRDHGDAVHAILESINLPVLSVPILRNGQALIDGGLVNNIPADVLVAAGCNLVIAVSVTAKMEKAFGDITPDRPAAAARKPSAVKTILRSLLVQNHSLNAIGVQPADVVIEPDVTGFELTAFTRATEMAAIGEAAALEQVPRIRQLLTRLDPQLFPPAG